MGTWDTGTLDNDEGLDILCGEGLLDLIEFFEDGSFNSSELLEAMGEGATEEEIAKMYFSRMYELIQSDDFGNAGIASCELAAYMNNKPNSVLLEHENVCAFIENYKGLFKAENIKVAFSYISKLIDGKYGHEEWGDKWDERHRSLKDLQSRLE